jgi:hypothetical protein
MNVTALILEQLDEGGLLKTFRLKPNPERQMVVAFPNEYDEPRQGPFHFLDPADEKASLRVSPTVRSGKLLRHDFSAREILQFSLPSGKASQ